LTLARFHYFSDNYGVCKGQEIGNLELIQMEQAIERAIQMEQQVVKQQ
jgi:hypothetical protein